MLAESATQGMPAASAPAIAPNSISLETTTSVGKCRISSSRSCAYASAGPTNRWSRSRAIIAGGDFTSQSRNRSVSADLSGRVGSRVQAANDAPVASTSALLQRSLMTRTTCPRATSRRTIASIGGVLPPPSQWANRNERGVAIEVIGFSRSRRSAGTASFQVCVGSLLCQHAVDQATDSFSRVIAIQMQIATQQLPDVDVRRSVERGEPAGARVRPQRLQIRGEHLCQPGAMRGAGALEPAVHERQPILDLERADVEITHLLVLIEEHPERGVDVSRRGRHAKAVNLDRQALEGGFQHPIPRPVASEDRSSRHAGGAGDLVERDLVE